MLVVLEAAGLLVDRIAADWHLTPVEARRDASQGRVAQGRVAQGRVAQGHVAEGHVPESRPARSRWPLWAALRHGVGRAVAGAVGELRHARERRKLIRVLSAKDDRLLADIGISRGQIREVADAAVRHGPQHPSRLVSATSSSATSSSASSSPATSSPAARVRRDAPAEEAVANENRARVAA
jgi:uncharacterized protein YjiS (DUF1127 family)